MATPQFTITANGDYELDTSFKPNKTVIYASGTMGAATVVVTYKNEAGTYLPLSNSNITTGEQYEVTHGANQNIYLTVTGADGSTSIDINAVAA
jgi:hypothetical protein